MRTESALLMFYALIITLGALNSHFMIHCQSNLVINKAFWLIYQYLLDFYFIIEYICLTLE